MKQSLSFCLLLLILINGSSCTRKQTSQPVTGDYMVVGMAGGFVAYPKLTYYLINNNQLKMDSTVPYGAIPTDINKFNFNIKCSDAKYQLVSDLLNNIPSELLGMNNQNIGNVFPDAGYTDIRASIKGTLYHWNFEGDLSGTTLTIRRFVAHAQQVAQ